MSITRKFNRARTRRDRRRETPRKPSNTNREFAMVTMPFGEGFAEPCDCPICAYLATVDSEAETLEDGTVVHHLTEQELLEVQALMSMPLADC